MCVFTLNFAHTSYYGKTCMLLMSNELNNSYLLLLLLINAISFIINTGLPDYYGILISRQFLLTDIKSHIKFNYYLLNYYSRNYATFNKFIKYISLKLNLAFPLVKFKTLMNHNILFENFIFYMETVVTFIL